MANRAGEMLIDEVLADFDATIVEHIVIDAGPDVVFQAARELDFLQVHSPIVDAVMFVRGLPARIGGRLRDRPPPSPPPAMRLADLFDGSEAAEGFEGWSALAEAPGTELVFGAIGKIWQPDIDWKPVPAGEFRDFAESDYAKVVAGLSVRAYGNDRTLLSYEARTAGTDAAASRKFLRYWWLVHRFVRFVLRAAVVTIKDLAEERTTSHPDMSGKTAD